MANPAGLEYPAFFAAKLAENLGLRSALDQSLVRVGSILQVSKLPFFPDYTDHGVRHLNNVLDIAERLIPERSHAAFTADDTAVLTFSILLHDLALHLSEAGLASLLQAPEWFLRWEDFLAEAKHWDDRQLVQILGADASGAPRSLVTDPFVHYDNLTETDRKLLGEFIRKHHAQMAYEFGISGFPGVGGQRIEFGSSKS